jgi:serine acetyltransferase
MRLRIVFRMPLKTLDQFRKLKEILTRIHKNWLMVRSGVDVPSSVKLSLSARLDARKPNTISVGDETLIAFKTLILTEDSATGRSGSVSIGRHCFIGGGSIISPGVRIGNQCIVGAGSVVFDDVPDRCIVGGNPARILRGDVELGQFGVMPVAHENTLRLWLI